MAQAGFKSPLPYIAFAFGGGTIVPVNPLPTTATAPRALISQLNIRSQTSRLQGMSTDISTALAAIQDNSNTVDERLRRLSGSLNSVGLTRDPAGNVAIQGSTFSIFLPLQTFSMINQSVVLSAPPVPLAQPIPKSTLTFWVDEISNNLIVQVTYSDGTTKTGTILLV